MKGIDESIGDEMKNLFIIFCGIIFIMNSGCTAITPETRSAQPVVLPDTYSASSADTPSAKSDSIQGANGNGTSKALPDPPDLSSPWWEAFHNDELNRLIEEALSRNFDIKAAWARLNQARAAAVKVNAGQRPSLDLDSDYTYQKNYDRDEDESSESARLGLGLAAGYEVDLWGRLASKSEAARLTALASRADIETLAITIAATIAEGWIDLLAVRDEMAVLHEQLETNRSLVALVEFRFTKSMASALDVAQQRETLAATEAEMPLLKAKERRLLNTLAVLTGKPPGSLTISPAALPIPIPLPEDGIPADLLDSRPDIQAAALRLKSAEWEVAVAKADRLPALRLSVRSAIDTVSSGTLFSSWLNTLMAGLTGPIFDGGSGVADVARARAVAEERIAAYGDTVLTALHEVEEMLINETYQQKYLADLNAQLNVTREALVKARVRFLKGQSDYFPFVSELLTTQRLERAMVKERANWIKYRIGLYRALGTDGNLLMNDRNNNEYDGEITYADQ